MINHPFFLPDPLVHALGWTLVHSVWQGVAIALVLWLILPRLHRAQHRYWLAYAALTVILLSAAGTFAWKYAAHQAAGAEPDTWLLPAAAGNTGNATPVVVPGLSLAELLEPYNSVIVTIWLSGLLVFLLRWAGGLRYIHRLRHRHNTPAPAPWQHKLDVLTARKAFRRPVTLLESALVHTPVAMGFFKPLILVPVGLINQLAPAEVEAILAHELAHITRRDWLFNLLQTLIETVFYFHPAVWWISATIRAERENCCDDAAVALSGNRLAYAKALVHLQALVRPARQPALALGLDGTPTLLRRRSLLLERIKRILHQPQPSSSIMEKTIALAILIALITLWTVRANTPPALADAIREITSTPVTWLGIAPPAGQAWQAGADTLPKPKQRQRIVREDDNQRVEMDLENGKLSRLVIDGKEIAASEFDRYRDLTDDLRRDATPPPPPAPPAPPAPAFSWEVAPAPPAAPGAPPTPVPAPGAPFPSRAPAASLSTEKDSEGNTIIRLNRNGQPMEIRVKDGEVWVDGKKVEDGETLDIPGGNSFLFWNDGDQSLRLDGNRLRFFQPDGQMMEFPTPPDMPALQGFHFDGNQYHFEGAEGMEGLLPPPEPGMSPEELRRIHQEALRNMELQHEEMGKELREQEKAWKKDRKAWSRQQKEQRRALEDAQRQLERSRQMQQQLFRRQIDAQAIQMQALERARREQMQALGEQQSAESTSSMLKNALLAEKLIADPDNFSLELSGKEMRVDGKKQPTGVHQRYLEMYRQRTGKDLGSRKIRIEVEN